MLERESFVCFVGKKEIIVRQGQSVGVMCDGDAELSVPENIGYMDCEDRTMSRLPIWENVFLGRMYDFKKFIFPDKDLMCFKTQSLMSQVGICGYRACDKVYSVSLQDRKLLELCRLLLCDKKLWVIDNVFEMLDRENREKLIKILQEHKDRGGAVLFVSRLGCDLSFCDSVVCLKSPKQKVKHKHIPPSCEVLLRATNLCSGKLKNINFKLHKGEILGIVGLKYGGVSDIGRILFGDIGLERGRIRIKGASVRNVRSARKRRVAYICPEFSKEQIECVMSHEFDVLISDRVCVDRKTLYTKARKGAGIIYISSNIYDVQYVSDRMLVLRSGEVTAEFCGEMGFDIEEILCEVTN